MVPLAVPGRGKSLRFVLAKVAQVSDVWFRFVFVRMMHGNNVAKDEAASCKG
jgi:hypothetical protein